MAQRYLLDTCTCVFLLRGKFDVAQQIDVVGWERCYISEITMAELKYGEALGRAKGGNKYRNQYLKRFLDAINILSITSAIDFYAKEKARLQINGTPADDDFDLLIGCTAVAEKMTLVTENIKDFKNIQGIKIENWITR